MNIAYCCTVPSCNRTLLTEEMSGLRCEYGHFYPFEPASKVPIFACEDDDSNEYAIEDAAAIHDNALRWVFQTFGTDEPALRKRLIARLGLTPGQTILVTGAGAGNDLPYMVESLSGRGVIYAQDIAKQMLMSGVERHATELKAAGVDVHFSASDATNLPFQDDFFDAAYHFGGINLFPDIGKGIAEMNRVVKPGGRVVISDEGIAPWLKPTELGKMLINNNALYAYEAPLALIPDTVTDAHLSWELSGCFYVIDFVVSKKPPTVNIDVPHVGRRGGTIRSRYFGVLEGVDPSLRDQIYAEAEAKGMSRVAFIESLLRRNAE
jgi:SAM-dependent methyltransferase